MDFIFKVASVLFYSSPKDLVSKSPIKSIVINNDKENDYKLKYPFEKRFYEIEKIKDLHPDKIPVYTLAIGNFKIKKVKYLVFDDLKLYQFMNVIKKNIEYKDNGGDFGKELYIQLDNKKTILDMNIEFGALYSQFKDKDGFLYLIVSMVTNYTSKQKLDGNIEENIELDILDGDIHNNSPEAYTNNDSPEDNSQNNSSEAYTHNNSPEDEIIEFSSN